MMLFQVHLLSQKIEVLRLCCIHNGRCVHFTGSPELKAQVTFLIANYCSLSVSKLFTFSSSSSPEPPSQFQPNLAKSFFGWRGFKFIQMKGPFIRGDNYEIAKMHWWNLKNFYRTTGPISTKLGKMHPWLKRI